MRRIWISTLLVVGLSGCTLFGDKNPPTLKSTTSAEQYERLLWSNVKSKNWPQVPGFFAANLVYGENGKLLGKDQVVPYFQTLSLADFTITDMVVKPNGPDMTLTYTLQLSASGAPLQTVHAVSVWQQTSQGWILIVHTEQPAVQQPTA